MRDQAVPLMHPKEKGEWAELRFMTRAAEHGLRVTKPWGDSSRYDFAVEHHGRFQRVQVKATSFKNRDHYSCHMRGGGKPYREDEIDFVAVYVIPMDLWYIIPIKVAARCTWMIILSPHMKKSKHGVYKEAWHLLRAE
jgi:hypothetical protein